MGWWQQLQSDIGGEPQDSGGGSDTPPNLDWGAVGNLLDQTAQYADDQPQNLTYPDQQQQAPPNLNWFDGVGQAFQSAAQYASNGYQLNQPDLPQQGQIPQYQQGVDAASNVLSNFNWQDAVQQQGQQSQPGLDLSVAANLGVAGQPPNLNLPPTNPDDYFGNIYRGIKLPSEQNAVANNRQGKMPWDVAAEAVGNVAGGLLGGLGAAITPIGGAVDKVADSGIPVLSQYAQLGRGFYENVDEPIFNATPSIVGDIANGQFPNVIKNAISNLNPFDNYDKPQITATKLKYVQDAYDAAIQNGMNDAQASQVAANLDRKLGNFANLSEYAGMEKFGTLPALAQLGIMLADPVGNLGGEALLAGHLPKGLTEGRIAESTLGGRLGKTILGTDVADRSIGDIAAPIQNALGYLAPMSQAGKVIGGVGKVTGLSNLLGKASDALNSPLENTNLYNVGTEEPVNRLQLYAADNPTMPERAVIGEFLNNPNSEIYHATIDAPQELTDYFRTVYDSQPLDKGDPVLQTQQALVPPAESKLAVDEQVAGNVPEAAAEASPAFDLTGGGPEKFAAAQRSSLIADTISDRAEALQKANPNLNPADAVEQVRNSPEIQALRDSISTPEGLAEAQRVRDAGKSVELPITPETNASLQDSFTQNLPDRPVTRMPTPLSKKYEGVTLPSTKDATIDEFYATSKQLKGVDSGYLKLDTSGKTASLRTIKPLENLPGPIGAPLRAWENVTHSLFARPFLNTWSRLVRDPLGNLIKLGVQDPETLMGLVNSWLRGGKDTTSQIYEKVHGNSTPISTGHASASADVSFAHGAKSPLAQLWYIASNPHNEIPALAIRGIGKLTGNKALSKFNQTVAIEKFEQNVKDFQGKKNYVREYQRQMQREFRKGSFAPLAKQLGITEKEILANAVRGTLPKGADLADYRDNIYNPSNFSPEKLAEFNQFQTGNGGPLGDLLKQTFDQLGDLRAAAKQEVMDARDKEVHIANAMKDKKAGSIRANTALSMGETNLKALDQISPDHPLVQKLWADVRQQVDNSFTAQAAVAVSDPKLVAAYKKAASDALDFARRTGDFTALRQSILDEIKLREPAYIQQYQKKPAEVAQPTKMPSKPAQKPVATQSTAGMNHVQQSVLDWSEKRYQKLSDREAKLKSEVADIGQRNMGRAMQRSQIKKWLDGTELGGKAKADRVLMYEPDRPATAGEPVYWMSKSSKEYNPAFEVPRGKQAEANVPREAQGKNGSSATTSSGTLAVRDWLEVDNPTSIPADIKTLMQKQGIWKDGISQKDAAYSLNNWWMDNLEKHTNPKGAAGWNLDNTTKKEPGLSSTQQANVNKIRTQNPSVGWKLHLTVDPANYKAVSDQLHSMLSNKQLVTFKAGKHGGQMGKDFTVYAGSKADAAKVADLLNSKVGHLIDTPHGLDDEVSFGGNIRGRFDLEHGKVDNDFSSYGQKGTPNLKDFWPVGATPAEKLAAHQQAMQVLKGKYGKFYDSPDDIGATPTPTTRMPGKANTAPVPTPATGAADPARVKEVLQGYYDSFFKTGTAKPTYDFSANEMTRAASGQGLAGVKGKILEADAKIREITGNRFNLDIDTMTPIGNTGSSFEGKHLTELVGRGKPYYKVKPPLGRALPKELKGMEMPQMLEEIKKHYGDDALANLATMGPVKRDAILNEIADTMLGVKPIDPLAGVDKASKEWQETHRLLDVAYDDIKTRYDSHTALNSEARTAREKEQDQQKRNTQAILGIRNRIAVQSHAAGYEAVKGTFFDYRNKNSVDQVLGSILPYQYWARQNFAYAMRHFATNPMHFAALMNFYQTLEKENADPNIPDYAKGDIFLWQNPDGSKVLWDFSSILPFNPLGSNDSVMQVVSPGDSTGRSSRNTDPLAILIGTDITSVASGKITGRDKGILPSFFRPNPILELAFKTGNVNNALQFLGIAKGNQSLLGQDYTEEGRPQKETSGFIPGNSFYQELGAATGLTKTLRGMKVLPSDLSPESLIDERLFGMNAGKPQTKLIQELTGMTQRGEISPEQGKLAIAAYKSGNWTPEALKALDAVQGENAGRRLLTNIGFTSIVVNTPRQQLTNKLYTGLSEAYDGNKFRTITNPDGSKSYIPSDANKFYTANPGASVLTASNDTPVQIKQGISDDKTRQAYSALVQQSIDKRISARDFNLELGKLQATNPQYFVDHPLKQGPKEQLYNEQLQQYQKIGGDNYDTLSKRAYDLSQAGDKTGAAKIYNSDEYRNAKTSRDQFMLDNPDFKSGYVAYLKSKGQDYKEPNPKEQKYFDELAAYQSIGGASYDAKAKAVSDAYASGNTKLGAKLYSDPVYLKYKAARDVFLSDHPEFKAQYDAYNKTTYGTDPKAVDLAAGNTSRLPSSSSKSTSSAKKPFVPYTAAQKKAFAISQNGGASTAKSSSSSSSSSYTPYTPAQKQVYAKEIAAGKSVAYARAAANNTPPGGTPKATTTTTRLPSSSTAPVKVTPFNASNGTTSTSGYSKAQAQGYAKAIANGKSPAYAAAVARNIGLAEGIAPTSSLTKPMQNTKTIANVNSAGYTNTGSKNVTAATSGLPDVYQRLIAASTAKAPTRLPSRRSGGGGGSRSSRLPANAIRFSPGRSPRQPVRFG